MRTLIAFFVIAVAGIMTGALAFQFGPKAAGGGREGVLDLVRKDTASSLQTATDAMNDAEGTTDNGEAALAHALLLIEHGGDVGQLERAEQLLAADPAEKKGPAGLYARAMMRLHPRAETDADLDDDLARAAKDAATKDDPFVLLAQAARAAEKKDDAKASMLLHKAALSKDAPPRALHALARSYAAKGELQTARTYLDRLHREAPLHTPSWATSVAVAILVAAEEAPAAKKDGEKRVLPTTETETKARALITEDKLPLLDAAELGLVLAATASARGDGAAAGEMLQRAGEQAKAWPGLVERLAELYMLDLEVQKADDLLKAVVAKFPSEIELIADQTRARVLLGLSDARLRQLKLSATRSIEGDALRLPLGRFVLTPGQPGLPLSPVFDPRFFPESEIRTALDMDGLTPQAAERRLDVVARLTLAELALAGGDVDKARDHVKAAREKTPSDPEVHLVEALVKKRAGDRAGSRESIEQALSVAPDDPRVLLAAARLQLDADDAKSARAALETLAKEGFTSPTALALAAMVSLREGDAKEARRVVDDAAAIGKDDLQVLRASLHVARAEQDVGKAKAAAAQMYQSSPDGASQMADGDDVVKAYLAVLTAERGDPDVAKTDVLAAAKVKASDADVQLLKGDILAESKDGKDDAIIAYEKASSLDATGPIGIEARRKAAKLQGKAVPDEPEPAPPDAPAPGDEATPPPDEKKPVKKPPPSKKPRRGR